VHLKFIPGVYLNYILAWGDPFGGACHKYPLHVACWNNAPIYVIRALIEAWPGALQTEAAGCLPLHEACTCTKSLPTIQLLVEMWPEAIKKTVVMDFPYIWL